MRSPGPWSPWGPGGSLGSLCQWAWGPLGALGSPQSPAPMFCFLYKASPSKQPVTESSQLNCETTRPVKIASLNLMITLQPSLEGPRVATGFHQFSQQGIVDSNLAQSRSSGIAKGVVHQARLNLEAVTMRRQEGHPLPREQPSKMGMAVAHRRTVDTPPDLQWGQGEMYQRVFV